MRTVDISMKPTTRMQRTIAICLLEYRTDGHDLMFRIVDRAFDDCPSKVQVAAIR